MLRREAAGNLSNLNVSQQRRTTPSPLLSLCVFSDLLRDNKPQHVMRVPPLNYFLDPVVQHLSQVCEIRNSDTRGEILSHVRTSCFFSSALCSLHNFTYFLVSLHKKIDKKNF